MDLSLPEEMTLQPKQETGSTVRKSAILTTIELNVACDSRDECVKRVLLLSETLRNTQSLGHFHPKIQRTTRHYICINKMKLLCLELCVLYFRMLCYMTLFSRQVSTQISSSGLVVLGWAVAVCFVRLMLMQRQRRLCVCLCLCVFVCVYLVFTMLWGPNVPTRIIIPVNSDIVETFFRSPWGNKLNSIKQGNSVAFSSGQTKPEV